MIKLIESSSMIKVGADNPKIIEEYFGMANSGTTETSIAKITSPEGWIEPGQTPEFNEYTVVLKGALHVKTKHEEYKIAAGQGILVGKNEWVQFSTPYVGGAEYIAVCLPAFAMEAVNRDK